MADPVKPDYSFGPKLLAPNKTLFRLWAPDSDGVSLEIDGREPRSMRRVADGFFQVEADCGVGARYRFRINCDCVMPDPASRLQDTDVHGASVVVDPHAYAWRNREWRGRPWHETVIYELHVGAMGGFKGVTTYLPELAEIGITAIELMPIAEFPGERDWGYAGALMYAPEVSYGTPSELKSLIDTAHDLGIMVLLDVVYNHFGPEGNYIADCARSFFRDSVDTPWGAAIDFQQPAVRDFFMENALYWLTEYRFDGLRLDAVHVIPDQEFVKQLAARVRTALEPERHIHLIIEHEGNVVTYLDDACDAQWNDDAHHALHVLLTDEESGYYIDYADAPAERLARCLAEGFAYQGEPSCFRNGKRRGEKSGHLPPTSFVMFLQNHDQIGNRPFGDRLISMADPRALRAAVALVLLCPHIPLIFMGEEWGSAQPFMYFVSHTGELAEAVKKGRREEFATLAEFADEKKREEIPDPNDIRTYIESIPDRNHQIGPRLEWRRLYRTLLAQRHRHIVPRLSGAKALGGRAIGSKAVFANWRMNDESGLQLKLQLYTNLGADELDVAFDSRPNDLLLHESNAGDLAALHDGRLKSYTTVALLTEARQTTD